MSLPSGPLYAPDEPGMTSPGGTGGPGGPVPPTPRRAGSITLRQAGQPGVDETGLDPANQSLADALRVMLRLLQAGMVVLGLLYLFSGLQSVKEGYRGIRLLFGQKQAVDLRPGFQWSAPYPMGELIKIDQSLSRYDISKDFWVYVPDGTLDPSPDKLAPTSSLKPDQGGSGSVITADGNIAHTKWKVEVERADVGEYATNVLPDDEEKLVRAAVKRGVVQAVARVTITELLQQAGDKDTRVNAMALLVAQDTLDRMHSGLKIRALTLEPPIPPLALRADFAKASAASAEANKIIQEAQTYRTERLNKAAGDVSRYMVYYIDEYEHALARKDTAAGEEVLRKLNSLMLGEPVEVAAQSDNGRAEVDEAGKPTGRLVTVRALAKGQVASTISEANLYKTGVVSRAEGARSRYLAKLEQFKANPSVMIQREWADAMRVFMDQPTLELMMVPRGTNTLSLILNSDPDIARLISTAQKKAESDEAERKRLEQLRQEGIKTETGLELHG